MRPPVEFRDVDHPAHLRRAELRSPTQTTGGARAEPCGRDSELGAPVAPPEAAEVGDTPLTTQGAGTGPCTGSRCTRRAWQWGSGTEVEAARWSGGSGARASAKTRASRAGVASWPWGRSLRSCRELLSRGRNSHPAVARARHPRGI